MFVRIKRDPPVYQLLYWLIFYVQLHFLSNKDTRILRRTQADFASLTYSVRHVLLQSGRREDGNVHCHRRHVGPSLHREDSGHLQLRAISQELQAEHGQEPGMCAISHELQAEHGQEPGM